METQRPATQTIVLNNWERMPILGLGTSPIRNAARNELALHTALEAGYRHFDTAFNYGNEALLGRVFHSWISSGRLRREELFITTKLPGNAMRPEHVPHFLSLSLTALQLDYVNLYLIHTPIGFVHRSDSDSHPTRPDGKADVDMTTDLGAIWAAMEDQVDAGRVKSIGLSNFTEPQIERIVAGARIRPANVQVEMHLYFQQKSLGALSSRLGISITAYAVLGSPGRIAYAKLHGLSPSIANVPEVLTDEVVTRLAAAHQKTPAQILIRFFIQLGISVIPKSNNPERVPQNANVFHFELSPSEMEELVTRDKNQRTFSFAAFFPGAERHPEFPF